MGKGRGRKRFSEIMTAFELPPSAIGGVSEISVVAGSEIMISGCRRFIRYGDDIVSLELCDGCISVYGRGLTLRTYYGCDVRIRGVIEKIELASEKKGKESGRG